MNLYPAIDLKDGNCVRLLRGDMNTVTVFNDDPGDQARGFQDAGCRWLHLVDLDGAVEASGARFQSSQHIRLRSDQDHQADVVSRGAKTGIQPHSAKEALDGVVKRVSSGQDKEFPATEPENETRGLRFSQLRRTSSKSEPHPLPGIKRLE